MLNVKWKQYLQSDAFYPLWYSGPGENSCVTQTVRQWSSSLTSNAASRWHYPPPRSRAQSVLLRLSSEESEPNNVWSFGICTLRPVHSFIQSRFAYGIKTSFSSHFTNSATSIQVLSQISVFFHLPFKRFDSFVIMRYSLSLSWQLLWKLLNVRFTVCCLQALYAVLIC